MSRPLHVRVFKALRRLDFLAAISVTCTEKVSKGSNVTPRILGFLLVGTGILMMEMTHLAFIWQVQGVKSVTDDFSGAMPLLFTLSKFVIGAKESERRVEMVDASREMSGRVTAMVTSSA